MWLFGDISSAADNKYHRTVDGSSISRRKFQPIRWVYLGDSLNNGDGKIAKIAISLAIGESAKLSVSSPVWYSAVSDLFITFFFSKIYIFLFLFRLDYQPGEIQLHWIRVGFGNPGGWFRLRNPSGALINTWLATMIFYYREKGNNSCKLAHFTVLMLICFLFHFVDLYKLSVWTVISKNSPVIPLSPLNWKWMLCWFYGGRNFHNWDGLESEQFTSIFIWKWIVMNIFYVWYKRARGVALCLCVCVSVPG